MFPMAMMMIRNTPSLPASPLTGQGQGINVSNGTPPSPTHAGGASDSPQVALNRVGDWFGSWTKSLSDRSVELSYAIIAANWAVFGSADKVLSSPYARVSIGLTVLFLGLNLGLTRLIGELLRRRYSYAEGDSARWAREFEFSRGKDDPWPSTGMIDGTARILREVRTWIPLISGGALLLGIWFPSR